MPIAMDSRGLQKGSLNNQDKTSKNNRNKKSQQQQENILYV